MINNQHSNAFHWDFMGFFSASPNDAIMFGFNVLIFHSILALLPFLINFALVLQIDLLLHITGLQHSYALVPLSLSAFPCSRKSTEEKQEQTKIHKLTLANPKAYHDYIDIRGIFYQISSVNHWASHVHSILGRKCIGGTFLIRDASRSNAEANFSIGNKIFECEKVQKVEKGADRSVEL